MKLLQVLVIGIFVFNPVNVLGMSCPGSLLPESESNANSFTTYVLDTNVLLERPSAFLDYGKGQTVAITEQTLRELDSKKTDSRLGWAAREFFRLFKASTGEGSLSQRTRLENGSTLELLTIGSLHPDSPPALHQLDLSPTSNPDNRILAAMLQYRQKNPQEKILFVTHDSAFGVLARLNDFTVGNPTGPGLKIHLPKDEEISYTGFKKHILPDEALQELFSSTDERAWSYRVEDPSAFYDNQFVMVRESDALSGSGPIILRYKSSDQSLHGLKVLQNSTIKNIRPKNLEQRMALELLMDSSVTAVTLFGKPGSGKTLITMAAALQQLDKNLYEKIYYAKPYQHTGGDDELGFLKGDFDEKTGPWHESFVDNLEPIFGSSQIAALRARLGNKSNEILRNFGMEPLKLGYSRGRSISNALIIIDEAQNLTHIQLKTLLTRVGEGSKIVLMGDLGQIDLKQVKNPDSSPFFKIVNTEAFKNSSLSGHTLLIEGLRSPTTDLFDKVFREIESP
ncbi:MAG: PhoH family protein [Bdellovibrionales bacterium]|nr:PhoH family protein [Bdellovibrionales bacterium]